MFSALFTVSFIAVISAGFAQNNATNPDTTQKCEISNILDTIIMVMDKCQILLAASGNEDTNEAAGGGLPQIIGSVNKCLKEQFDIDIFGAIKKESVQNVFDQLEFVNPQDKSDISTRLDSCFTNGQGSIATMVTCIPPILTEVCQIDIAKLISQATAFL